ncbi:MAG: hypothetical protein ABI378_15585, partial [Chitinophagaceae bacterium]
MGDIIAADQNARAQSDANCDAITPPCPKPPQSKVLSAYFAKKVVKDIKSGKKKIKQLSFEKINGALFGSKVWIVIDTIQLRGKNVTIEILGSKVSSFIALDEALPVTFGDVEVTKITVKTGEYSDKKEFVNAAQFMNQVIAEVDLKPKDKIKIKESGKKLHDSEDKKALLHLRITADGGTETEYCNEDQSLPESSNERSILLNIEKRHFELTACFCDRNFSLDELKTVVKNLRNEEKIKTTALFFSDNCPLPENDKTYERFLEELNAMLNKFGINTCIRKLHFIAQSYHESGRFGTTLEGASGDGYNPGAHREAVPHGHT